MNVTTLKSSFGLFVMALLLGLSTEVRADDTPFAYIYTADSVPKGHWEYEQWNTVRTGKDHGSYTAFDLRNEVEYGFTDRLQAAFYLNSGYLHSDEEALPGEERQSNFDVNGVSLEFKYRILSPYKDPIGLSLYVEPELAMRSARTAEDVIERAIETKLILQKNFLEDRLVLASNITFEPEWEREDGEREKELKTEYALGASYRLAPGWMAGIEALNRRVYEDQNFGEEEVSAFFVGPAVHYSGKAWWATLTALPQIDATSKRLGEYERMEVRLRFGLEF